MLSKKATKIDEIFSANLTSCSKCQIDDEDFVNFCGLLGKYELEHSRNYYFSFYLKFASSKQIANLNKQAAISLYV